MSIEQLESSLEKISLNEFGYSKVLYYSLKISIESHSDIVKLIPVNPQTVDSHTVATSTVDSQTVATSTVDSQTVATSTVDSQTVAPLIINKEFHITMLYTGKKLHQNSLEFDEFLGKEAIVEVHSYAISDNFIVLGVSKIYSNDNNNKVELPYYGNPIKHITYAVKKGCKPVNSPSAFTEGKTYELETPLLLTGILDIVLDQKKNEK